MTIYCVSRNLTHCYTRDQPLQPLPARGPIRSIFCSFRLHCSVAVCCAFFVVLVGQWSKCGDRPTPKSASTARPCKGGRESCDVDVWWQRLHKHSRAKQFLFAPRARGKWSQATETVPTQGTSGAHGFPPKRCAGCAGECVQADAWPDDQLLRQSGCRVFPQLWNKKYFA